MPYRTGLTGPPNFIHMVHWCFVWNDKNTMKLEGKTSLAPNNSMYIKREDIYKVRKHIYSVRSPTWKLPPSLRSLQEVEDFAKVVNDPVTRVSDMIGFVCFIWLTDKHVLHSAHFVMYITHAEPQIPITGNNSKIGGGGLRFPLLLVHHKV